MANRTEPEVRRLIYTLHQQGQTYAALSERFCVSRECVRYWCRKQRDGKGVETVYPCHVGGALSHFHPRVRYCILRLRLEHPRWGPRSVRHGLQHRPSLRWLKLPSEASIGRYLHQWSRFRRSLKARPITQRAQQPSRVHQRWQIDFKEGIALQDGTQLELYTIHDPVGEACLAAHVFPAGQVGQRARRITLEEVRWCLRQCFGHWQTLPQEIQTDGEPVLVSSRDAFPSRFTLWLQGLGINHLVTRRVTQNAEVERCHRTIYEYAIVGHEHLAVQDLQAVVQQSVEALVSELPSQAAHCARKPPIQAHPQLLSPPRPFQPEQELARFDLQRVDAFLSRFTWHRRANKKGYVVLGGRRQSYFLGRSLARSEVTIRFDPQDRCMVFSDLSSPPRELRRLPAKHLDVASLIGQAENSLSLVPQQLPLPLPFGVNC